MTTQTYHLSYTKEFALAQAKAQLSQLNIAWEAMEDFGKTINSNSMDSDESNAKGWSTISNQAYEGRNAIRHAAQLLQKKIDALEK